MVTNISFVATVLNEEKTIKRFLNSLINQSKKPNEIIIIDGGSKDKTVEKMQSVKWETKFKIFVRQGCNRAQGRNFAIKKAKNEIIAISDAGCILDKNWLKNISRPFENPKIDVVAGYYQAKTETLFEKCIVPFVLVMPDKIRPGEFLPASRSMAIRKKVWQKFGGFPEEFPDNEDYVFGRRLEKGKAKIVFARKALVFWLPRSNLKDFWVMIYRFARGDSQASLRGKKTAMVFFRYLMGALLLSRSLLLGCLAAWLYLFWAVGKNYRYIKHPAAFLYLPLLQITSDWAVMTGTIHGMLKKQLK